MRQDSTERHVLSTIFLVYRLDDAVPDIKKIGSRRHRHTRERKNAANAARLIFCISFFWLRLQREKIHDPCDTDIRRARMCGSLGRNSPCRAAASGGSLACTAYAHERGWSLGCTDVLPSGQTRPPREKHKRRHVESVFGLDPTDAPLCGMYHPGLDVRGPGGRP